MFRISNAMDRLISFDTNIYIQLYTVSPDIYRNHRQTTPTHMMNPRHLQSPQMTISYFQTYTASSISLCFLTLLYSTVRHKSLLTSYSRGISYIRRYSPLYLILPIIPTYMQANHSTKTLTASLSNLQLDDKMTLLARYGDKLVYDNVVNKYNDQNTRPTGLLDWNSHEDNSKSLSTESSNSTSANYALHNGKGNENESAEFRISIKQACMRNAHFLATFN